MSEFDDMNKGMDSMLNAISSFKDMSNEIYKDAFEASSKIKEGLQTDDLGKKLDVILEVQRTQLLMGMKQCMMSSSMFGDMEDSMKQFKKLGDDFKNFGDDCDGNEFDDIDFNEDEDKDKDKD